MQTFTSTATASRIPATVVLRGPTIAPSVGSRRSFAKGDELFAEGDAAEYFYKVVSGTVRTCKLLSDGRRQIDAFHLCGDVFGLESGAEHRFTAEAVEPVVVQAYKRSHFTSLLHDD